MDREPAKGASWVLVVPAALLAWFGAMCIASKYSWGYGPVSFVLFLVLSALVLFGRALVTRLLSLGPNRLLTALLGLVFAGLLLHAGFGLLEELQRPENKTWALDTAVNTYLAGSHFLAGRNPYAEFSLIWHRMLPGPHITVDASGVRMFGVPYAYGYPYFPAMFLSYLPARLFVGGYHSLRIHNGLLLLANLVGIWLLVARLVPKDQRRPLCLAGGIAYLAVPILRDEFFRYAIPDIVIATYALYAYLALSSRRFVLAGLVFGVAQACKLLPGPLLILPALAWLWRRPGFKSLLSGYLLASLALILPFVVRDPARFLSSTVLFYLTFHAAGDDTSLFFFLPAALKTPFRVLGVVLSLVCALWTVRLRERTLAAPLGVAFASYAVWIAFNNMIHLNYLWGIYTLGCAALAAMLVCEQPERSPQ